MTHHDKEEKHDSKGVSSTYSPYQSNQQSAFSQVINDFNQVGQALQSGDLTGAQKAFAALQKHHHHHSGTSQGAEGNNSSGNSAINNDFNTLAQSLQSGDLKGAQQAFATLQQGMQNTTQVQSGQQTGQNSRQSNDFSALANALQSGDLTGAQLAFASLMQDAKTAAANFFNSSQTTATN